MHRSRVLASVAVSIALVAGPGVAASARSATAVPAASGSGIEEGLVAGSTAGLGRIIVETGTHYLGPQDEMLHGTLSLDADLGAPALTVPFLRQFTEADEAAGLTKPVVHGVAPSPDGQRLAFWVTDPDGFVVPGGTRPWGDGYTGESLVVMDVDGRNRRVVHDNPDDRDIQHLAAWPGTRMTWLDAETLLVPGRAPRTSPATGTVGVGRTVDVDTGALGTALKYDDGDQQVRNIDQTAAGGGTKVGLDMGTFVRIVHHSGAVAPIDPADDEDNSTVRDVDVSADGDHIAFLEQTPVGDGTVLSRVAVLDYAGNGEWIERTIVDNVGDWWVRWLPYESVDSSHLLVQQQEDSTVYSVATGADVPEEERVRVVTEDSDLGHSEWVVQPLPQPGSGSADVEVEAGHLAAQVGEPFDTSLTVTNNGPDAATGVRLEVGTSEGVLSALTAPGVTCMAGTGTCELGDLAVGESVTVEVAAPPLAAGIARLKAEVTVAETDWNTGNSAFDEQVMVRVPPGQGSDVGQLIKTVGFCDFSSGNPCNMRIVTVDSDGTDQQVVVAGSETTSLSLWDVHRRTGLFLWSSDDRSSGASSWNVSELDGSLVRSFARPEGMLSGAITPDGRTLVYFRRDDRVNQPLYSLMTLRLDVPDAQPRLIVSGSSHRIPNHFRVSPDGTRVAYLTVAQGTHGAAAHVVDLDGRHDRAIPMPSSPTGSLLVQPHQLVWSPDGERVALRLSYAGPYDPSNIVLVPVDGGSSVDLGLGPDDGDAFFQILDWSPDAAEILTATQSRVVGVDVSDRTQVEYAVKGLPYWTGLPPTGGGTDPVEDTTAPTGSYEASGRPFLKPGTTLTLTRAALADDVDALADLAVQVSWGDGTLTEGVGTDATFQHTFEAAGTPRVTVKVIDQAGNHATLFDRTVTVDGTAPVVTVAEPACGKRKPKVCASYRQSPSAWSKAGGKVTDAGGSGVGEVVVTAVQKRGRGWWALTDTGWKKFGKRGVADGAAASLPAAVRKKAWTRDLADPAAGKLVLVVTAADRAGNDHTVTFTRTLSR